MVLSFPFLGHLLSKKQSGNGEVLNISDLDRKDHAGTDLRNPDGFQFQGLKDPVVILEICLTHLVDLRFIQVLIHLIIILEQPPLFDCIGIFMYVHVSASALFVLPYELHTVIGI